MIVIQHFDSSLLKGKALLLNSYMCIYLYDFVSVCIYIGVCLLVTKQH